MKERERKYFLEQVAEAAVQDWKERHICLPSLVIALAAEGTDFGKQTDYVEKNCLFLRRYDGIKQHKDFMEAVRSHNNYLLTWRKPEQKLPNWELLIGRQHYILAVQYLQEAKYPYSDEADFEKTMVELIERYDLAEYDD